MDAERRVKITKTDDQWRQELTPEQYQVTRQHGTGRAFSNPLNGEKRAGMFNCVCCGAPLFSASTKFDSGTGLVSRFRRSYPFAARSHTNARRRARLGRVSSARSRASSTRYACAPIKWPRWPLASLASAASEPKGH
jgi:peptide methionine sulfoxide reductase MsrB